MGHSFFFLKYIFFSVIKYGFDIWKIENTQFFFILYLIRSQKVQFGPILKIKIQ